MNSPSFLGQSPFKSIALVILAAFAENQVKADITQTIKRFPKTRRP
jgi:hypothetical protein